MTYEEAKVIVYDVLGVEGDEADRLAQALTVIALHAPSVRVPHLEPKVVWQRHSS